MIFTTHIIIGGAVGSVINNPYLSFVGGFISHHAVDAIPHLDPGSFTRLQPKKKFWKVPSIVAIIFADVAIGSIAFYLLWRYSGYPVSMLTGAIGAVISDIVDNGPWQDIIRKWTIFKRFHAFHEKYHRTVLPQQWLVGTLTQLILIIASVAIIVR